MVYGDTQTSGKRERLIYAHIDRALAHKHIQFALDHQNDSLEQLAAYLRRCADEIGYLPRKCEIIGGEYLDMRFGGWEEALAYCCPGGKKAPGSTLRFEKRKIVRDLYEEQARIVDAALAKASAAPQPAASNRPKTRVWRASE